MVPIPKVYTEIPASFTRDNSSSNGSPKSSPSEMINKTLAPLDSFSIASKALIDVLIADAKFVVVLGI